MRKFADREGRRWEAAVAFGSYGEPRVIFSLLEGDELRSAAASACTQREAELELDGLTDQALRDLLDRAQAWR